MFTARVRKAIYALSVPLLAVLVVLGIEQTAAAAYIALGIAAANLIMAFLNVPGDE
jgi:hypothetical protein